MLAFSQLEEIPMSYVRVVRFTGVDAERLDAVIAQINESDGPPPGVPATALTMLHDEEQSTAIVLQHFATEEDMQTAARAFDAMDASETPGTRTSVDMCELKLDREA